MRSPKLRKGSLAACLLGFALAAVPGSVAAAGKGHGSTHGTHGAGSMEGHGTMKMGDKVFDGMIGPWHGEARLVDMKAQLEMAKVSPKVMAAMKHTHHLSVSLEDPATKAAVTEGTGTVTLAGPGGAPVTYELTGMQGHFGADVTLDKPGEYQFAVEVESGGRKGTVVFSHGIR
jgi:hypothetical protein